MPRFFVSVFVLVFILWGVFLYLLLKTAPVSFSSIFIFLVVLFLALGMSLSIPGFFILRAKSRAGYFIPKEVFRRSLKWSMFVSFGVIGFLSLRAFDILNMLNGGLFFLLYSVSYFYLRTT